MGSTGRDKHVRANRKTRSAKMEPDNLNPAGGGVEVENPVSESGVVSPLEVGGNGKSVVVANPIPNLDVSGLEKCKEVELEEVMLRNLECLYREAIVTLVRLGHKEEVALRAVLKNGHCYGSMDAMSNIVHNALMYLNEGCKCSDDDDEEEEEVVDEGEEEECEVDFVNLRQLAEYSLVEMVCMLKRISPEMSKADAMWCLLMGDINVGRDSQLRKEAGNGESCEVDGNVNAGIMQGGRSSEGIEGGNSEVGIPPGLCKFHGGWGFGDGKSPGVAGMGNKSQCPKRFDFLPPVKEMLNKSVSHSQSSSRKLRGGSGTAEDGEEHRVAQSSGLKLDVVISMLNKLHEMKMDEKKDNNVDIQKDEMIANLMQQIKELEKQVEERREWARDKAMQAARRLSSDLTELKILRMEREEETQRLRKGKESVEDPMKKRFAEMESALRKASGQVDRANAAVRRLENENAEMRAEMEAAKLSASENVKTCLEIAKREKKSVKRLMALDKQKTKLQEEIGTEKKKISDFRQEIIQVEQAQKVTEAKWKQEIEAKDQALAHLEELRRTKETIESENKRRHEALRLKIEIDFQRHKDDLQRLEQELARLKLSANPASSHLTKNSERSSPQEDTIARMLTELDLMDDSSETEEYMNRECLLCMKDEVSVVFLPCAHQVICASCNETYGKNGKPTCPCCRTPIHQRICVFGASS